MKRYLCLIVIAASIMSCSSKTIVYKPKPKSTSSSTTSTGKVPPGQMKKITGEQSAKSYAPGQQKKSSSNSSNSGSNSKTSTTKSSNGNSGNGNGNSKKKN